MWTGHGRAILSCSITMLRGGTSLWMEWSLRCIETLGRGRRTGDIPGYAAKLVEDRKFYADKTSKRPVSRIHGGLHTLVPFAVEDGGRLGTHAQALLRTLAERAVREGRSSRPPYAMTTRVWHAVMEPRKCPYGSSARSAISPPGYTSPCRGSSFDSSAPGKRWRTSTPREKS